MADWGDVGVTSDDLLERINSDPDAVSGVIAHLSQDDRRRFTELLNVELAELQQKRGAFGEDLKREADIEKLIGMFARVGEKL
jgi:hypothetical protein